LARSVEDVALALEVLGLRMRSQCAVTRVGIVSAAPASNMSAECVDAVQFAAAALASRGIAVDEVEAPGRAEAERIFDELTAAETRQLLGEFLPERLDDVSPQLRVQWEMVDERAVPVDSHALLVRLEAIAREFDDWLLEDRLLLAPVATTAAYPLGTLDGVFDRFDACKLASALGLPAAAVPVCINAEGLPVGVQLIAARGAESALLRGAAELAAASLETFTPRLRLESASSA
jgi:Asp-tRNA(Asn)/Glu-tRNA(Gln) amidotransferase A subunit family amidase